MTNLEHQRRDVFHAAVGLIGLSLMMAAVLFPSKPSSDQLFELSRPDAGRDGRVVVLR